MRVLVVEDEIKLAEYLRKGLSGEGFVVDVANNPDGHPNSPTSGHPKLPHPEVGVTMV